VKPPVDVPTIRDYLRLLAKSWWAILLAVALSVGAGWLYWHNDHTYVATTRLLIVTPGGATPPDAYYGDLSAATRVLTMQNLAQSTQVTSRAIDQYQLNETPATLAKKIVVVPSAPQTAFIELRVTGDSPQAAMDAANSVTGNLIAVTSEIEGLDKGDTELLWIDHATHAGDGRASKWRSMAMGGMVGLSWSIVIVLTYWLLLGSVLDRKHIRRVITDARAGTDGR